MTVRLKILTLSAVLLVLFAAVLVSSMVMQTTTGDEMEAIIEFNLPLAVVIADLDVVTSEYELAVQRLLRRPVTSAALPAVESVALDQLKARIRADFESADTLVARALTDPRTDGAERVVLARVQRSLLYLRRMEAPFLAVGEQAVAAYAAGKPEEAVVLSHGFRQFEQAYGADLSAVRDEVSGLAKTSAASTHQQQARILQLNVVLFAVAVVLGLTMSAVGTKRMVRALWRLVDGTRAIEAGDFAVSVPVTTRDEIGDLTHSFNRMAGELRTKERITDTFGKYVDPRIVARLIDTSKDMDQAERRVATVMFSDLKGFTAMSEQLTATAMVKLLNAYFTMVTEQIRAHNGILEKYIGDAVMAFWAPPFSPADGHAASACLAALAHIDALAALRPELPDLLGLRRNVPELTVRMGVATGEVVIGTIGAPTAKSFAAIGDITNLASRLEGVNKAYGTTVILAEETYRLAQSAIEARELDLVVVAGKSEPSRIFELLGGAGQVDAGLLEVRDLYVEGLDAYRRRDWVAAERRFAECLRLRPDDGPAGVLRDRSAAFTATPPPPDWAGVWHLTAK
jgi:adenylate cyclase